MAKSLLVLLCCAFLPWSLWAQAIQADTSLPQKLELKKTDLHQAAVPVFFTKKMSAGENDGVRSLLYNGSARQDLFNLWLPAMKNKKFELQIKASQREPLFRRQ